MICSPRHIVEKRAILSESGEEDTVESTSVSFLSSARFGRFWKTNSMASGAGFHQSVLDVAFDKISKKYPSFKRETGRRMIDSLSGAYKSLKSRRQRKESENGSVNILSEEEMKLLEKDQEDIPEVKVDKGIKSGVKGPDKVILKKTEEEYSLKNEDDVHSSRKSEDGDFSKKSEKDSLEKSDDSDDSDFLTADEDEDLGKKDSTKDKPSSKDPEKGIKFTI